MAVLLAVMLLFGALPALGVSAAGETDGVTVTATSNFFPTQTVHLSAEELAEKDNKVTVTYCIRSDETCLQRTTPTAPRQPSCPTP